MPRGGSFMYTTSQKFLRTQILYIYLLLNIY